MRALLIAAAVSAMACLPSASAWAGPGDTWSESRPGCSADVTSRSPWSVEFGAVAPVADPAPLLLSISGAQDQPARRAVPVEYSEAYKVRAKIHKIASFATLPLFVANYFVGQDLYNHPGDESKKGLHGGLAASTAVLFGVNSVTGVWNLVEGRKDPNHRTKRTIHGILMLVADAGFVATGMLAPEDDEHESGGVPTSTSGRSTHRTVALTSMAIATVGYLIMLVGGR